MLKTVKLNSRHSCATGLLSFRFHQAYSKVVLCWNRIAIPDPGERTCASIPSELLLIWRTICLLLMRRFVIVRSLTNDGKDGWQNSIQLSAAIIFIPRQACSNINNAPTAHACGEHATGYKVGDLPLMRWNPQKSSGSLLPCMNNDVSKMAVIVCTASVIKPYLAKPIAIIALSCGHIDPLW